MPPSSREAQGGSEYQVGLLLTKNHVPIPAQYRFHVISLASTSSACNLPLLVQGIVG